MSEAFLNGAFLLVATLIGSGLTLYATRRERESNYLKQKVIELRLRQIFLYSQIEAYHLLENEYSTRIAKADDCSPRSVKTRYRDYVVESHGCARPHLTANSAREAIARQELKIQ